MDRIRLVGGNELRGEIPISGAKNAALPLMIASLLTDEPLVLHNVPRLADVKQLERILENHGVDIAVHGRRAGSSQMDGQRMTLHAADQSTAAAQSYPTAQHEAAVIGLLHGVLNGWEAARSLALACAVADHVAKNPNEALPRELL